MLCQLGIFIQVRIYSLPDIIFLFYIPNSYYYSHIYIHTFPYSWFLRLAEHALLIDQDPDQDDEVTADADVAGDRGSVRGGAKMVDKAVSKEKSSSGGFLWTVDKFESAILAQV